MAWWLGIVVGVGVMGGYAALRLLTHRLAQRQSGVRAFLVIELGGVLGRMALVLSLVALVLVLVPVNMRAFVGTVVSLLVISIIAETVLIARRVS